MAYDSKKPPKNALLLVYNIMLLSVHCLLGRCYFLTTSLLMNMHILQLLVFMLTAVANSDSFCPTSYCPNNNLPIAYPFRLHGHPTPNCSYTNLRCTTEGAVVLDLPGFGDFYVREIVYGHGYPLILLYDPRNCLTKRLMGSNHSSFSPGVAACALVYTFYTCPPHLIALSDFPVIGCLSNSSSAMVATRTVSSRVMTNLYRCKEVLTSFMPVGGRDPPDFIGDQTDFALEWHARSCSSCPHQKPWVPFDVAATTFTVISAAAIITPGILCVGCCISLITVFRKEFKVKRSNAA